MVHLSGNQMSTRMLQLVRLSSNPVKPKLDEGSLLRNQNSDSCSFANDLDVYHMKNYGLLD